MSDTFDLFTYFDVMCEQFQEFIFPFSNDKKELTVRVPTSSHICDIRASQIRSG